MGGKSRRTFGGTRAGRRPCTRRHRRLRRGPITVATVDHIRRTPHCLRLRSTTSYVVRWGPGLAPGAWVRVHCGAQACGGSIPTARTPAARAHARYLHGPPASGACKHPRGASGAGRRGGRARRLQRAHHARGRAGGWRAAPLSRRDLGRSGGPPRPLQARGADGARHRSAEVARRPPVGVEPLHPVQAHGACRRGTTWRARRSGRRAWPGRAR
jgi:hypothetical protein